MATVDVTNPEEFPRDRAHPPLVTGAGLVFTSISHTDGWVALGASDIPDASRSSASSAPPASPVAIDIEPMRPRANWRALAEYAFDDETVTLIAATSDPLTAFYAEWVAYESRIKYPKPERDDWYAAWGRVGASVEEQPRMATRVFEADPYPLMVGTLSSTPPRYVTGEALLDVFPQLRRLLG